jgi:hypothetical protein
VLELAVLEHVVGTVVPLSRTSVRHAVGPAVAGEANRPLIVAGSGQLGEVSGFEASVQTPNPSRAEAGAVRAPRPGQRWDRAKTAR